MVAGSFAYPSFVSILPYRPEFENEHPYGAPQLDVPVCLNVNENPYAPSAELVADIAHAVAEAAGPATTLWNPSYGGTWYSCRA